jgi:uncharacterized protein
MTSEKHEESSETIKGELLLDLTKYENLYDTFDAGHDRRHMEAVRKQAVELAKKYAPDKVELAYIAATLHDIGISKNREDHEKNGEEMILTDETLKSYLSAEDLKEVANAVREHRASNGNPETILAKIISDADKTPPDSTRDAFLRGYNFGLKYFPELREDEQLIRVSEHLAEKFSKQRVESMVFFPETAEKIEAIFTPIIEAYQNNDFAFLRSLIPHNQQTP